MLLRINTEKYHTTFLRKCQKFLSGQIRSMGTVAKIFWTQIGILSTYFLRGYDTKSIEKFDKHAKMTYHFKTKYDAFWRTDTKTYEAKKGTQSAHLLGIKTEKRRNS